MTALSKHAQVRRQQRCVPPLIIEWLDAFGTRERADKGMEVVWFDKNSRKAMSSALGHQVVDRLGELLDAYLIYSERGTVVTVGWRHKRIIRH